MQALVKPILWSPSHLNVSVGGSGSHIIWECALWRRRLLKRKRNLSARALYFSGLRLFPESGWHKKWKSVLLLGGEGITRNLDEGSPEVGGPKELGICMDCCASRHRARGSRGSWQAVGATQMDSREEGCWWFLEQKALSASSDSASMGGSPLLVPWKALGEKWSFPCL